MSTFTIADAEQAIVRKFRAEGFQGTPKYDASKVIETDRWWYIPYGWVGCFGQIVDKKDLYVDWLGSGMFTMQDCFWAHDLGIVNDVVDFTIHDFEDISVLITLFSFFGRLVPKRSDPSKLVLVQFLEPEIRSEIRMNYPLFKNHHVWSAIRYLKQFSDEKKLSFSCVRSQPHLTRC